MIAGVSNPKEKFPEGKQTRDELGSMAGVSGDRLDRRATWRNPPSCYSE